MYHKEWLLSKYETPDRWTIKAQKEGYPARSVYKLSEMDEKFGLLPKSTARPFSVLDLGASPGSWSLYVLRKLPGVRLCAADLVPLSRRYDQGLFDRDTFYFVQGDIQDAAVREALGIRGPYHLILSDIAPATTGNRLVDTQRSLELAECVLEYAAELLAPQGTVALKIFQGGEEQALLQRLKGRFAVGRSYKPQASRSNSFETYYLGLGAR